MCKKKIAIDIRSYNKTGINRYAYSVTDHLLKIIPEDIEITIFGIEEPLFLKNNKNVRFIKLCDDHEFTRKSEKLIKTLKDEKFDLYYSFNYMIDTNISVPYVFTIYDLTRIKYLKFSYDDQGFEIRYGKKEFQVIKREAEKRNWITEKISNEGSIFKNYFIKINEEMIQKARAIITISKESYNEIGNKYGIKDKLFIVTPSVDKDVFVKSPRRKIEATMEKYGVSGPYFLVVGTAAKHKRLDLVMKSVKAIRKEKDIRLVIVGRHQNKHIAPYYELAQRLKILNRSYFLDDVPDKDLVSLYSGALSLIIASQSEGFCLPALEAKACGTKVLSTSLNAIKDAVSDWPTYYKSGSLNELVALEKKILRGELEKKQEKVVNSWANSAQELLKILTKAIDDKR